MLELDDARTDSLEASRLSTCGMLAGRHRERSLAVLAAVAALATGEAAAPAAPQLPSIGFDVTNWTFDTGTSVEHGGPNGTTICITGNPHAYVKATCTVAAAELPSTGVYYFAADTQLHDIVHGDDSYMAPKLKVTGKEHPDDHTAEYLALSLDMIWMPTVLSVKPDTFKRDTHLTFEISIQQASGRLCARAPRLSYSLPPPSYVYPFSAPSTSLVTVTIDPQTQRPFRNNLLSANSQLTGAEKLGIGYSNATMQQLLQWLSLPQLRFPGGTVGNFYDWNTDQQYPTNKCDNHAGIHPGFRFDFDGYLEAMVATNSSSVLMFNVIGDSVIDSVARLKSRKATSLHIDWIELGNENYESHQSCGYINPNNISPPRASDYIDFTSSVVSALTDANTPMAAPLKSWDWHEGGWNDQLITAKTPAGSPLYNGFVMHPYVNVDAPFTAATAAQILQASGVIRGHLSQYANATTRPLLLTEWGILGTTTGTFLQTLGLASMFMGIVDSMQDEGVNIVQAGLHILFQGSVTNPCAMFSYDPLRGKVVATPNGVLYKKLVTLLVGSTLLGTAATGPFLPPQIPAVDVRAFRGTDGKLRMLIVNKLGVTATILNMVGGTQHGVCALEVFSNPPLSFQTWDLEDVEAQWVGVPVGGATFAIAPVSIAVATLC